MHCRDDMIQKIIYLWKKNINIVYMLNFCLCGQTCVKYAYRGFPGGTVVENLPVNAGDTGSSPGLGRSHMPRSN